MDFAIANTTPGRRIVSVGIGTVLFIVVWQALSTINALIPTPGAVFRALLLVYAEPGFATDFLASAQRVVIGFGIALATAFALFAASYFSQGLRWALAVPVELLRPIPPLAWIPISIVLFGLTDSSAVFIIFLGALFPLYTAAMHALTVDSPPYIALAGSLRGRSGKNFLQVVLPASGASLLSGVRVAIGFAWMCVVVAEMTYARSGLGYELQLQRQLLALDQVVAYMAIIGAVGAVLSGAVYILERALTPWRFRSAGRSRIRTYQEAREDAPRRRDATNIELSGVDFRYATHEPILSNISLHISDGEIVAVVGVSGTGKTTLLKLISGELNPTRGQIEVGGVMPARRERPAWILQDVGLFPWQTAYENSVFQAIAGQRMADVSNKALYWLNRAGLSGLEKRYPHTLSGGQSQRVQLVRSLVADRSLILMDEPFSKLDAVTKRALIEDFGNIMRTELRTAVIVTHSIEDAVQISDRIIVLGNAVNGSTVLGDMRIRARSGEAGFAPSQPAPERRQQIEVEVLHLLERNSK